MATKAPKKSIAAKPAILSAEEFKKLTPQEQFDYATAGRERAATSEAEAIKAKAALKVSGKKGDEPLPSFEVDEDKKNDVEGGTYDFTCRKFSHKGKVYEAAKLLAAADSDNKKEALAANEVLATLVAKNSGIIKLRKED